MDKIQLFENQPVRSAWNNEEEEWYFSVVDVVRILTEQPTPRGATLYWSKLKERLKAEGASELLTNCQQLKLTATDGKKRLTDVASTKQLLRIIQSIPSPKAEPFKLWLAQVGSDRLDEMVDPELAINRAVEYYRRRGHSDDWINQRLRTIEMRKELTDEWKRSGVENDGYAILTNELYKTWAGMSAREYKDFKGLKKENLRDNMTNLELALNTLAEVSTTEISKSVNPQGLDESKKVAREGGNIAKEARKNIEKRTGRSALTRRNAKAIAEKKMKE